MTQDEAETQLNRILFSSSSSLTSIADGSLPLLSRAPSLDPITLANIRHPRYCLLDYSCKGSAIATREGRMLHYSSRGTMNYLMPFKTIKTPSFLCKGPRFFSTRVDGPPPLKNNGIKTELSLTRPDDWHLHLRDGDLLKAVVPHSASHFGRAIVMPNLKPPVTTTAAAVTYQESILNALPPNSDFTPLMTLYLTDNMNPNEIKLARRSGVVFGVKLYPAGATTNSQDGVRDLFGKCLPVLEEMVEQSMPLLVHGEVTDPEIDVFDREKVFIDTILRPLVQRFPQLKVVMEHITTLDAVKFIESCNEGSVAATVTPQHLLLNRNSLFRGGLQPHYYCLPVLKREIHRQAIVSAATSGSKHFFLGTDSAPHERRRKECSCGCAGIYNSPVALSVYAKIFEQAGALDKLEAFTSFNGPDFYGLPRNTSKITLSKTPWRVPESYKFASGEIIPMFAGEVLDWHPSTLD